MSRAKLREHVEKGDPRDVAAYCAFLWYHGERTGTGALDSGQRESKLIDALCAIIDECRGSTVADIAREALREYDQEKFK